MGIARYRDAETGELIPGPTTDRDYVVERPIDYDWGGDPIWPNEKPVTVSMSQEQAKELLQVAKSVDALNHLIKPLEMQIWKYRREDYV